MATAKKETVKKEVKLNPFQDRIKRHLDERAAIDELFAVTYSKKNKTIVECCNYVMKCAREGGRQGYDNDEVFNWAVHYYDEDNIKDVKAISGKVVIDEKIELTEDEKNKAREEAIERFVQEEKKKVKLDHKIELSSEDLKEVREKAIQAAVKEATQKMLEKKSAKAKTSIPAPTIKLEDEKESKVKEEPKQEEGQQSLF